MFFWPAKDIFHYESEGKKIKRVLTPKNYRAMFVFNKCT